MSTPSRFRSLIFIYSVFSLLLLATPSWAVDCGENIGPGEVGILTEDLNCFLAGAALTLDSSSILNLGGHTIECNNGAFGVWMTGGGSILQNGTVMGCGTGVRVEGDGRNIVTKVTATGNVLGFEILSDDNELRYNTSQNNTQDGYRVTEGTRNTLKYNLAKDNESQGFVVTTNDNTLTKNRSISNNTSDGFALESNGNTVKENLSKGNGNSLGDHGFQILGNDNELLGNRAIGNFGSGILMNPEFSGSTILGNTTKKNQRNGITLTDGATSNTLLGNVAGHNTLEDFADFNFVPPCDNNTWLGNIGSRNQDCIH